MVSLCVCAAKHLAILLKITFPQTFKIPSLTAQPSGVYWPTNCSHLSSSNSDLCLFYLAILLLCSWAHLPTPHTRKCPHSEQQGKYKGHLIRFLYLKDHFLILSIIHCLKTTCSYILLLYGCWWHEAKPNISYSIMSRSSDPHHFLICSIFILQFKDLQISIIFWFMSVFLSLETYEVFIIIFSVQIFYFIPLWSKNAICMIPFLWNLFRLPL